MMLLNLQWETENLIIEQMSWFFLVNQKHTAQSVSDYSANDSYELIHFSESKTYSTTQPV